MSDNIQDQINAIKTSIVALNGDISSIQNLARSTDASLITTITRLNTLSSVVTALSNKVDVLATKIQS